MSNEKEVKKTKADPLGKLAEFLSEAQKPDPKDIKPPIMTDDDMEIFFNQQIIPVFKKIKTMLQAFTFESVSYEVHTKIAKFTIVEKLRFFIFKIEMDNVDRRVKISYELKYRNVIRQKLFVIRTDSNQYISFAELDKINNEYLLTLFTDWYMNKEELITRDREWRKRIDQKEENND